jgi:iron complex transport system permease protein
VNLRQASFLAWILLLLALGLAVLGICVGSAGFENLLQPLLDPLKNPEQTAMARQIVWDIRLPRTLGAWAAGALLGLAGALAQGLFRNPLADPFLLGSASGASLGVALALAAMGGAGGMLGGGVGGVGGMMGNVNDPLGQGLAFTVFGTGWLTRLGLTGAAFGGAVLAVFLTLALSKGVQHTLRLLLAGVVVGVVLGAMTHLVLLWTPESLQAMQAFMLGSTAFVGWTACAVMLGVWLLASVAGALLARMLDALSLGEATAHSLGLPLAPMRLALVAVLALATGAAVAQTGLIAFVGLAAPHLVRSRVKTTHGRLILLSSLMGGVLLMAADTLARWLIAPQELPVGVLTAVLGGGYLLWLMHRGSKGGGVAL